MHIMVPSNKTDAKMVLRAGQHQYERLLEIGCRLYLHQHNLLHQKILIVDRKWSHVGSTNFDERSFDINAETSLGIFDPDVAAELKAAFDADMEHCEEYSLERWRKRSLRQRISEKLAWQLHELL